MSARDQMAALFLDATSAEIGLPYTALDAIARLATHPATAPAVFAWLVEAGVLKAGTEPCDCTDAPVVDAGALLGDGPWHYHYHAAMDHEKASGVRMPDSGVELIAAERQRQIEVEGWTPDHDADHGDFDLVKAAHSYVLASLEPKYWGLASGNVPVWWPWDEEWWKPSDDEIRNLVKAGALIAAAIDRLRGSP